MKQILLSCLFAASIIGANAQVTANLPHDAAGNEAAAKTPKAATAIPVKNVVYITPENQWSMVDMKVSDNIAWFQNIKGISALRVYVTNSEGDVVLEQKLSARANGVDVSKLKKGNYFITVINENTEERKAFVLPL